MRFSIVVILALLLGGSIHAQEKVSPTGELVGWYCFDTVTMFIKFKDNHSYVLHAVGYPGQGATKLKGTWQMEGETLTLVDAKSKQPYMVLERQKGDWYVRDEKRAYTFRARFTTFDKRDFRKKKGQGC